MRIRNLLAGLVAMLVLAGAANHAAAQTYPNRAITLVIPFAPGGSTSIVGRVIADKISETLGEKVIIENRPGAGGTVGTKAVAKSEPDGYTLLLGDTGQLAINRSLYRRIPYDALKDFSPVGYVARFPFLLVATPGFPANSVRELIALAKQSPATVTFASTGVGTPQHLGGQLLMQMAGIQLTHVPYRGGAPALVALLAGEVQIGFVGVPPTLQHLKSGKLRALGISTATRSAVLPDVPPIAEAGLPGYDTAVWFGLVAPAGTPPAVVQKLSSALRSALQDPQIAQKLREQGLEPAPGTPAELASFMASESVKWRQLVEASGATVE